MKIGDLVDVTQELGCHTPPREIRHRGLGVVLAITKTEPINFNGIGEVYLGDNVTIQLLTGEMDVFHPESIKVVD